MNKTWSGIVAAWALAEAVAYADRLKQWEAGGRQGDRPENPDDLTSDFERYGKFPEQVYSILQSRGRDLAGSAAYWHAVKVLGFDPNKPGDHDDKDADVSQPGGSGEAQG